jgi:putative N6-adenine-specific DNA methylase
LEIAVYKYQEFSRYFAQLAGGTEELGAQELTELGATDVATAYRGCHFSADPQSLYRINYESRLATRILAPLTSFGCHDSDYLYRALREVKWTDFLTVDKTFAVFATVTNSKITHSKYAALRVKDAIVDTFREAIGDRPNIDTHEPDVWFNLFIENNHATLSLDTSGGSLHRRGYRLNAGAAPMQETVAAAIIRMTEWNGERPLLDPMCGSGTLLAEALMHVTRTPAGFLREAFGFEQLPDFDAALWGQVRDESAKRMRKIDDGLISGSDIDPDMVRAASENLARLPEGSKVSLSRASVLHGTDRSGVTVVTNPPYGRRLSEQDQARALIKSFGDTLKQHYTGSTAFIYVGERELLKHVGLRPAWKKPLVNGALDGRLAKYELY